MIFMLVYLFGSIIAGGLTMVLLREQNKQSYYCESETSINNDLKFLGVLSIIGSWVMVLMLIISIIYVKYKKRIIDWIRQDCVK